jgi:hypothetical protein
VRQINIVRAAIRANPTKPIVPWMAMRSWIGTPDVVPIPWGGNDWWQEGIMHALLSSGRTNALWYNPVIGGGGSPPFATRDDERKMYEVMQHLYDACGGVALTSALTTGLVAYSSGFFVSAALTAGGRLIGRVTFQEGTTEAAFSLFGRSFEIGLDAANLTGLGVTFTVDLYNAGGGYETDANLVAVG